MEIIKTFFNEQVKVIKPQVFSDDRGFFQESYNKNKMKSVGIENDFIQDNHSYSTTKGTIRGLHFQKSKMAQTKLVRVVKGIALDIIVDIRTGSPTFGKYKTVELSESNYQQVLIPKGFAHGFCTLTQDCHFVYKVDEYYSPEENCGIIWNDPFIKVKWPTEKPILSKQDLQWAELKEDASFFQYGEY